MLDRGASAALETDASEATDASEVAALICDCRLPMAEPRNEGGGVRAGLDGVVGA